MPKVYFLLFLFLVVISKEVDNNSESEAQQVQADSENLVQEKKNPNEEQLKQLEKNLKLDAIKPDINIHDQLRKARMRRPKQHVLTDSAFYGLLFIIVGFQMGLYFWKKKHNRSYLIVTLIGLIGFPFFVAIRLFYWRMLFFWGCFMISSGFLVMKAKERPLDGETPRKVYTWFYGLYRICNTMAITGYLFIVMECFGMGFILGIDLMTFGLTLLFYGLYYGVLGRDSAEICCDFMVATMGYKTKSGLPLRTANANTCSLCLKSTRITDGVSAQPENTFTLECKHIMHESCIKGWVMVGKKDTCPVCNEKVDLSILPHSPWDKQERTWAQLLDALRYLIVWNPVIIIIANYTFSSLGIDVEQKED